MKNNRFYISFVIFILSICAIPHSLMSQNKKQTITTDYHQNSYWFGFTLGMKINSLSMNYIDDYQTKQFLLSDKEKTDILHLSQFDIQYNHDIYYTIEDMRLPINIGYTIGDVFNLRLYKDFHLRLIPSMNFSKQKIDYTIKIFNELYRFQESIELCCIELPILVKYEFHKANNRAAFILAGTNYKLNLSNQKNINTIITKSNIFATEIGAGVDFYTPKFRLGIELKMSYGLNNIIKEKNFSTNHIDK